MFYLENAATYANIDPSELAVLFGLLPAIADNVRTALAGDRELTDRETRILNGIDRELDRLVGLPRRTSTRDILYDLGSLSQFAGLFEKSPLCFDGNGCGACGGCTQWPARRKVFESIRLKAGRAATDLAHAS